MLRIVLLGSEFSMELEDRKDESVTKCCDKKEKNIKIYVGIIGCVKILAPASLNIATRPRTRKTFKLKL